MGHLVRAALRGRSTYQTEIQSDLLIELPGIDAIEQRLRLALQHIDSERLLAAPDCGLMMLGRRLAMAKLENMCAAAARI